MASKRAKAHAIHTYHCSCGKTVRGNGAKSMHFYIEGSRIRGKRPGHFLITEEQWLTMCCDPSRMGLQRIDLFTERLERALANPAFFEGNNLGGKIFSREATEKRLAQLQAAFAASTPADLR